MEQARQYLELFRISNLPTVWINTLAAYLISGGQFSSAKMVLLLLAVTLMYCGGMAMNDWLDRDVDRLRRPDRPIPSGRISADQARNAWMLLFATALCLFFAVGGQVAFCAGLVLLLFITTYNLGHHFFPLAVIPMAGCRFMVYIITGIVAAGRPGIMLLLLALIQFGYVLYVTVVARREKAAGMAVSRVPVLLAGIPLVDGIVMALLVGIGWLAAGIAGGAATLLAQNKIRGD